MSDKPEYGAGDIEIDLDGERVILSPSLEACLTISRAGGIHGPGSLADRLQRYDIEAYMLIIRAGAGIPPSVKGVDEKIFRSGMTNLVRPLSAFLANIANGGRPRKEVDDERPQGAGEAPKGE